MNTQQKNHLLIKEMVGHIVSKKPHIVILDMDDYHTIMNSISQEDQATFQDHEVTVSKFFSSIGAKQIRFLCSEVYSDIIVLYPIVLGFKGNKVMKLTIPQRIDIRFYKFL